MSSKSARKEILALFHQRGDDFVSGAQISRALGVSRTAIWKQIEALRKLGYDIEAVTSRGYRLRATPDTLLPGAIQAGLQTTLIGRDIVYLESTDSTNQHAYTLGESGAVEGTTVIADFQSGGKGRLGRRWCSPAGVNFYGSILVRPVIPSYCAPRLTFVSAVAVAEAIQASSGLPARVKWPNDVLIGGRKVAGLLNEMSAETERIHFVVFGIGVNLNMDAEQFPPDLRYPATSLRIELGRSVSRVAFARELLQQLDHWYRLYLQDGIAPVLARWQELFDLMDQQVEIETPQGPLRGVVAGLDEDGALLLRLPSGARERILAGDVRPLAGKE